MNQIHQYVRRGNKLIGVLVGTKLEDGTVRITASKCNESHGDKFDKKLGLQIAANRSTKPETIIAHSMIPDMIKFVDRCSRYFDVNPTDIQEPAIPVKVLRGVGIPYICENGEFRVLS